MIHFPFIFRELSRSSNQALVFVLCVTLSLGTITAFSGFSQSVDQALSNDARELHAADIIIRSDSELSDALDQALKKLVREEQIAHTRYYEFNSVIRSAKENASLLSDLKIVEKGYPFYGTVVLKSGRAFHEMMTKGSAVVGQSLLDRLGLQVGDAIHVGYSSLTIRDVVVSEPDRPVNFFSFGPRVFVSDEDREALGLIEKGSRISYMHLLKVRDPNRLDPIAANLRKAAASDRERVDTFKTARSSVKRFLDNFLFFLKLVGFFIMIVAGFGIQGTLTAFINEKKTTIAMMKTMGATNRYITVHFMFIVFFLASVGIMIGLITGYMVQHGLAWALASFLPPDMQVSISWPCVLEGIVLGFSVVTLFAFLPMYRLKETRPVTILRKELGRIPSKWPFYASWSMCIIFFSGLILWHMKDLQSGLIFIGGIFGLILIAYLLAQWMLYILKKLNMRSLAIRQAVKGLFRRGGSTKPVVITLTASLCVIFSIFLIEKNLETTFVQSFPEDLPNLFFLDIQPSQVEDFASTVGREVKLYPVVQARIEIIAGEKIDRQEERRRRGDSLSRVFNVTYRDDLLDTEEIIKGRTLFQNDWKEPQISVLDTVLEMKKMNVGDKILFRIQGVPLEARISSIRTQIGESMSPFFYFVFQKEILKEAPQTIFSSLRVEKDQIAYIQNQVVSKFPNISVIDVSETIKVFSGLMKQLSVIVQFFSLLSVAAGILILISTIFATRAERIIESVYYRVLGAKKSFVFQVLALENMLIGLLSALLALALAQISTLLFCKFSFDILYRPFLWPCMLMLCAAVSLVVVIGIMTSKSIMDKKPITFLREQPDV